MLGKLIENTFKNTGLKRVRIKSDPSVPPVFGYENVTQFEGYVLEECGEGMVNVYIINAPPATEPVQQISVLRLEPVAIVPQAPSLELVKTSLLNALVKAGQNETSPVFKQIQNTNSMDFIKTFLMQANISLEDLISSSLNEAWATATVTTSPSANPSKDKDRAEEVFGSREGKYDRLLKATGQGLSFLTKAVGKGADLTLGKDNIVARLNRFLKSFNINDLIDVKKVTDKIKTKYYDHLPYNNEDVIIAGLPKLPYQRFKDRKYQLRGRISGIKLTTDGLLYVVSDIQPAVGGITKVFLDFAYLQNPSKTGRIIFENKAGTRYYNKGTISLVNNVWVISLSELNVKPAGGENKKDSAYVAAAIDLLRESLGKDFDEIARMQEYSSTVVEVAMELKTHRPETLAQIKILQRIFT